MHRLDSPRALIREVALYRSTSRVFTVRSLQVLGINEPDLVVTQGVRFEDHDTALMPRPTCARQHHQAP